ncbi:MAG: VWA domain-containing protein [Acidobacteriota bacterium]
MSKRSLAALVLLVSVSFPVQSQRPLPSPTPPPAQPSKVDAQPQKPVTPPPDDTDVVRIRTNLVQIDAVVTKDGKQVTDLTAEDFEIFEDGRKQVITNFSYVSNLPSSAPAAAVKPAIKKTALPSVAPAIRPEDPRRTIALVVDDLGISMESVAAVKSQLRKFIDEQTQPNDLVAIIRTGGELGALQQFTTDKRLLHRAVDRLRRHQCSRMGPSVFTRIGSMNEGISLCSNDTLKLSARALRFVVQGMGELPGRKSMVILSDSLPLSVPYITALDQAMIGGSERRTGPETIEASGNLTSPFTVEAALKQISELAIRSSVVIYAVDTQGLQYTGMTAADSLDQLGARAPSNLAEQEQAIMRQRSHQLQDNRAGSELVAKGSGGFLVRNSNDFQLQRVMSDQEGYYLIGYRPTEETFNRRFHEIKAQVKRSGMSVRTRKGFFGVTDEDARPPERTNRDKVNLALTSPFAAVDIDVQLTTLFTDTAERGSQLSSLLYFQARDLTFTEEPDGWRQAVFDLSGIIFGDNGSVAHQRSETRTLRLRGNAYEQVLRRGLTYQLNLPAPKAGSYQVRVAVRDAASSRLGTAGQFVEVPNLKSERLALSGITASGFLDLNEPASSDAKPENIQATAGDREAMTGPAQRRFRTPSNLYFGYVIYNAQLDKATRQPRLTAAMRVLRDGKVIFEGQPKAVDLTGQAERQRITAAGGVQLGTDMAPGEYILQITVTDLLANDKEKTTTQWVDFEIVK